MVSICHPLTELTKMDKESKKPVSFVWTEECERFFSLSPILTSSWKRKKGVRAPIADASRATNAAKKKFGVPELDVAALVYSPEHFEAYLLGNSVTVFTDHKALVQSHIPYLKSHILAYWYLRLSRFLPTFKMEYKPGSANVVADALSRAPQQETEKHRLEEVLLITEPKELSLQLVQEVEV